MDVTRADGVGSRIKNFVLRAPKWIGPLALRFFLGQFPGPIAQADMGGTVGALEISSWQALRLSRTMTLADLVSELKTSSSKWLKEQSPALSKFSWQLGYGAFSIGPKDLESVTTYIDGQEEHHGTKTFQEEYRGFLQRYGMEFDERYVWD